VPDLDKRLAAIEQHLADLKKLSEENATLAAVLGNDYTISPDIVLLREPEEDAFINEKIKIVDDESARFSPLRKVNSSKVGEYFLQKVAG